MSLVVTNVPCPSCLPSTISFLANQENTFETFCVNPGTKMRGAHKWNDRGELNATIEIAKKAYPERYAAPQASPPTVLSKDIYIDPETKKAIEELVKQPLSGAGDLKGILFDAIKTAEESEKELKTLRATVETMKKHRGSGAPVGALAPNQCIITIPEWAESEVDNFAEHEGKTRGEWLSETVDNYLENFCTQKQEA